MEIDPRPVVGDAFGAALLAHLEHGGSAGDHVIERDDGYVLTDDTGLYFAAIGEGLPVEISAIERARGRVLDIGTGAGRFALELQKRGHDVVALDVSAGCLEVCRRLGVEQTFSGTIFDLAALSPQPFETFLLMGHNLGLLGTPTTAPEFLDTLRSMAAPGARIIGSCRDPMITDDPDHLAYHQLNRDRGRPPGHMLLRTRWRGMTTPWFDYWFFPVDELERLATASGWELVDHVSQDSHYLAELRIVDETNA